MLLTSHMKPSYGLIIIMILLVLMIISGGAARAITPTPSPAPEATEDVPSERSLMPFTMGTPPIHGVAPAEWDILQPGTYIRDDETDINTTYIVHLVNPGLSVDAAIEPLLEPLQLESLPEAARTYEGGAFEWTLYETTFAPPELDGASLRVTLATAENDDGAYIIVLQGQPQEFEMLAETVLTPALEVFGLPRDAINAYLEIPALSAVTIEAYELEAHIPADWREVNLGAYMRAQTAEDFTTLLVQSSPDLDERDFAALLLESLNIDVGLPDEGETFEGDALEWTFYPLEFEAQAVPVTLQIATAADDERTYMVALLSASEEAAPLYAAVLLPVVSSVRAFE